MQGKMIMSERNIKDYREKNQKILQRYEANKKGYQNISLCKSKE